MVSSSRRNSPTSLWLISAKRSFFAWWSLKWKWMKQHANGWCTHAWWKTMIPVGSNFLVSSVERAVTPKPYEIVSMDPWKRIRGDSDKRSEAELREFKGNSNFDEISNSPKVRHSYWTPLHLDVQVCPPLSVQDGLSQHDYHKGKVILQVVLSKPIKWEISKRWGYLNKAGYRLSSSIKRRTDRR